MRDAERLPGLNLKAGRSRPEIQASYGALFLCPKEVCIVARPRKEIDKDIFENACELQCTLTEIASLFGCSEDTIERWCKRTYGESFADIYKKKSEKGKISLRRNQLKLSETNATMAIWLGKQWLGQRDAGASARETDDNARISLNIQIEDCGGKDE